MDKDIDNLSPHERSLRTRLLALEAVAHSIAKGDGMPPKKAKDWDLSKKASKSTLKIAKKVGSKAAKQCDAWSSELLTQINELRLLLTPPFDSCANSLPPAEKKVMLRYTDANSERTEIAMRKYFARKPATPAFQEGSKWWRWVNEKGQRISDQEPQAWRLV